jgi:insulysin
MLKVNNSAFRREYVLGTDSAELRAAAMVLANFIGDPFYSELRTRQQLGYIVGSTVADEARQLFVAFIIQSGEYPADVLEERADAFIRQFPALLAALPDDGWATLVAGVRAKLEEKDKSIAERASRFFDLAYERNADFNRREATLAALGTLTKARAGEVLSTALAPSTARSRTFLGFSREHQPKSKPAVTFTDVDVWKGKQRFE